jgi:predicted ATPase
MLTRIHIQGYKSLKNVEVRLSELSVLFGPNAAGKSNFLDCLQLLSKLATSRTIKEAFEPPYRGKPLESFTFGEGGIEGALAKERLSFSIEADVRLSDVVVDAVNRQIKEMRRSGVQGSEEIGETKAASAVRERNLRYRIEVEMLPKSGILRVADEYLAALNSQGEPTGKRKPFLSREGDRLHLRLEGQAHPSYYERYLDHSILSLPHYPPHYPHLVAMRKELENWLFFYFEPRERMRASNPVKEVRHIGLMGEELAAFLNTLKALDDRQFRAVEKALHTIMPNVQGIGVEVTKLGEVELTLKENGIPVPARILSEGTLRILGLLSLAGAKEQPSLVGFEEPENGIHPRRIQLIAELLRTRASSGETQYIVTTHSPLLPDLVPDESLFVCKRVEGETRIEPFSAWGALAKKGEVDRALMEEEDLAVSERMLRGDFDA